MPRRPQTRPIPWKIVAVVALGLIAGDAGAVNFIWDNPSGTADYIDPANWTPAGGPPVSGDRAYFDLPGSHTVVFPYDKAMQSDELRVENGIYYFEADDPKGATYEIQSGAADAYISQDAILLLGGVSSPVALRVGDLLRVDEGGRLYTGEAGSVIGANNLYLGTLSNPLGTSNRVEIVGNGSTLDLTGGAFIGANGGNSTLYFEGDSVGAIEKDTVVLNFTSADNTRAFLGVTFGSKVTLAALAIGQSTSTTAEQTGRVSVFGEGAEITQTGAVGVLIGVDKNPNLESRLEVFDGGAFHSGTGTVRLKGTGELYVSDATFNANGPVVMDAGSELTVTQNGALNANAGLDNSGDGVLDLNFGELSITGGAFVPGSDDTYTLDGYSFAEGQPLLTLGAGASMHLDSLFYVGETYAADLTIKDGAQVSNSTTIVDAVNTGGQETNITVTGSGTRWDMAVGGIAIRDGANAVMTVSDQAVVTTDGLGIREGSVAIDTAAVWNDAGSTTLRNGATLTIDTGGTFTTGTTYVGLGSLGGAPAEVHVDGGLFHAEEGVWLGRDDPFGTTYNDGLIEVTAGGQVQIDGRLTINEVGTFTMSTASMVTLNGEVRDDGGVFDFFGGYLTLGDPDSTLVVDFDGLKIGTLDIQAETVRGNRDLTSLGTTVVVPGASLTIDGGVARLERLVVSPGSRVDYEAGVFEVTGSVQAATGSVIDLLGGDATLGDAARPDGVFIDGQLRVYDHTASLGDSNDAVFGSSSLVVLGNGLGDDGTLVADNGISLLQGGNITGDGVVVTPDDPTRPLINNGHITGSDPTDPLELTGYVKGEGTLDNVVITGTDAPGFSPATVVRGSVEYAGVLEIELAGAGEGDFDRLEHLMGAGEATLGGELVVALLSGFRPASGDVFEFLTTEGGVSGLFTTETLPALGGGIGFDVQYGPDTVSLAVVGVEGDYNGNGVVDAADFTVWRDSLNQTGEGLAADGDGDGAVDQDDYAVWVANFGQSASALAEAASVPEPASLALLLVAATACGALPRRA
ncbi:hypothetical protein Mal64_28410 [Pseudobythopirellula maris]|uniref:Autotransporter-associated beta strand repeat protein n=1 Tax=Pseudobythopirellula maris TaxID=2527991 RepID=A0A5C5ZLH9_9BACT|nr:hypothetical protein [Pseudobythopirellula maris]TWT87303.1 hypothetical protein Mal64_28410 [Pseudobythopirellula maris]